MQNSLTLRNKYSSIQLQKQGNGNLVFNYYTGSLIQPTNTPVFMDLEQGNIGIGTPSPVNNSGYGGLSMNGSSGAILSMMQGGSETFRVTNATGYSFVNTTGATPLLLGTNAIECMRISPAGNVGIGTSSPYSPLQVGNYTGTGGYSYGLAATFVSSFNSSYPTLFLGTTDTTSTQNKGGSIAFGGGSEAGSTPYTFAQIKGLKEAAGSGYSGYMSFFTTPAGSDANTERMRINSSGNVGIGTSNPSQTLDVYGVAVFGTNTARYTTIGGSSGTMYTQGEAGGWAFGHHAKGSSGTDRGGFGWLGSSNDVSYYYIGAAYNTATMYITSGSTGRVGIGTSNPTLGILQVSGNVHATSFTGSLFGTASWASNAVTATTANSATSATTSTTSTTLASDDNRTISPNELAIGRMGFGFTSWTNNNSSPWADYLHLRSYIDSSGGNDNLVMFRKDAIGMRIYQQTFGSSTAYSSFKDVAWTDGTNATGTWGVSITGTATNASSASVTDTTTGTGPYYLMFADGTTGNRVVRVDSSTLQFNATTNTLTVPNLAGTASLATTASFATTANNVNITTQDTTPVTFNVTFVGSSTGANTLNVDTTALRYTPSTSTFETPIVNSTTAVRGGNGSASAPAFSFSGDTDNGMYYVGTNSIGLATAGTARVVIDSSGNVGVKATTMVRDFQVGGFSGNPEICIGSGTTGTGAISFGDGATGNDPWRGYIQYNHSSDYMFFGTTNANRLQITSAGAMGLGIAPTNTSGRFEASNDIVAYSSSDKNWKKNIKNIDSPLEKLSQINGVEFDWIEDEPVHGNKGHDIGVIAQEIEQVLPEIVQTRESGMKAVQYDKIIPLLVECIKDQQKQIEELKQIVNGITR